ncbi:hypothetical protein RI367_000029 [Sorochytrium milnesiophthora]
MLSSMLAKSARTLGVSSRRMLSIMPNSSQDAESRSKGPNAVERALKSPQSDPAEPETLLGKAARKIQEKLNPLDVQAEAAAQGMSAHAEVGTVNYEGEQNQFADPGAPRQDESASAPKPVIGLNSQVGSTDPEGRKPRQ